MKKLKLSIIIVVLPLFLIAQEESKNLSNNCENRNEIGLNLFSITNLFPYNSPYSDVNAKEVFYKTKNNPFCGIYYKHYVGKNSFRVSYDFLQNMYSNQQSEPFGHIYSYEYSYQGTEKTHEIKLGYERIFGNKRIIPFFLSDLVLGFNKFKGTEYYNLYVNEVPLGPHKTTFYLEQYKFGIAPGGGIKIKLNENILLTYEFSALVSYSYNHDITYKSKQWNKDFSFAINPIKMIGFGILF